MTDTHVGRFLSIRAERMDKFAHLATLKIVENDYNLPRYVDTRGRSGALDREAAHETNQDSCA